VKPSCLALQKTLLHCKILLDALQNSASCIAKSVSCIATLCILHCKILSIGKHNIGTLHCCLAKFNTVTFAKHHNVTLQKSVHCKMLLHCHTLALHNTSHCKTWLHCKNWKTTIALQMLHSKMQLPCKTLSVSWIANLFQLPWKALLHLSHCKTQLPCKTLVILQNAVARQNATLLHCKKHYCCIEKTNYCCIANHTAVVFKTQPPSKILSHCKTRLHIAKKSVSCTASLSGLPCKAQLCCCHSVTLCPFHSKIVSWCQHCPLLKNNTVATNHKTVALPNTIAWQNLCCIAKHFCIAKCSHIANPVVFPKHSCHAKHSTVSFPITTLSHCKTLSPYKLCHCLIAKPTCT